ncbi:tyrosine--tRNA ligase [Mariniplasma anaerobium]|uniref:Tyrosine--tRNA ligase n=1 Tax=Mariniplasma anaerobium TaxID=2735436 RepID=A0A7U9XWK2_9MOLU|nr:tyrosine--tRNA ligase [Mariniplasma anaerobium]BCR36549.1 tyrosine--tRNA ligase 1 [Mariniplasma anaerobium]
MKLYEDLLWRGLIKDVSNEEEAKKLLNEESVKFYCGFDPTGQSLTVGHLVQIVRMLLLEKYGHTPIVLIGGATGLIGDPRQTSERKLLTLEESLQNADKIKMQLSQFLNPQNSIFVNNYDWIKNIDMISFLRDYGKHFSINYMLAKDTVQKRLDVGISYTEFSYMLIQAIDFLHLYQNHDCKIQFGGSDQWGNITTGLELIRKIEGDKASAVGLSSPLLLKADGQKFGKSESGALWLDSELTSPYEVYQYFINASDQDVITYLKTLTLLDKEVILDLEDKLKHAPELRAAQKMLAYEVVKLVHGQKAIDEALRVTDALFSGEFSDLTESEFKMISKTLDTLRVDENLNLIDLLVETKLAQSKREARQFVTSNAVSVNGEKISDIEYELNKDNSYYNQYVMIRRGKKKYALVVMK